jgi:anti-sigma factor RsiW
MSCTDTTVLLHALLDGELDAGNAREVEAHLQDCVRCAGEFRAHRRIQEAIAMARALRFDAPLSLRRRIEKALPPSPERAASRRGLLKGFVMGTALSTAMAASLVIGIIRSDEQGRLLGDVVSAHVRSLQGARLTDVDTSDQHTVKPWFNGKLDLAPPVVDLTARGFTLVGGRLDYLDGQAVAVVVYRRRKHVINLFVASAADFGRRTPTLETSHGYNIYRWGARGLDFFAVSDINSEELREFVEKFERATA